MQRRNKTKGEGFERGLIKQLGVVFPGQGSQSVGMLADVANQFSVIKQTFDEASDVLGYDLWALSQQGPVEELDKTTHTQPALLTAAYAIWRVIESESSFVPALLAGHSLGEYTALVCANAIRFADGVKLVAARGEFMQDAVSPGKGAMAAIVGLDDAGCTICKRHYCTDEILHPLILIALVKLLWQGIKHLLSVQ